MKLLTVCLVMVALKYGEASDPFANNRKNYETLTDIINCDPATALLSGMDSRTPLPSRYIGYAPTGIRRLSLLQQQVLLMEISSDLNMDFQDVVNRTDEEIFPPFPCSRDTHPDRDAGEVGPPLNLVERLFIARYTEEGLTGSIFTDDVGDATNVTFGNLECEPYFAWTDAGFSYFPRYFAGGICYPRQCSIPDREEFTCQPDLGNPDALGGYTALRWDCCWTIQFTAERRRGGKIAQKPTREFRCGWRKVRIPIVCDCDCSCNS